eukprot:969568-Amphidinium_carterae.1
MGMKRLTFGDICFTSEPCKTLSKPPLQGLDLLDSIPARQSMPMRRWQQKTHKIKDNRGLHEISSVTLSNSAISTIAPRHQGVSNT